MAELVAEAVAQGEFDVVELIAGQLPARMTARLLGFPEEMWPHGQEEEAAGEVKTM